MARYRQQASDNADQADFNGGDQDRAAGVTGKTLNECLVPIDLNFMTRFRVGDI
ncbi:hypothetical protein [Paenibacillus sp. N3.4]|uniref:hypothetical protein n=1 Tax=Paenibacillus sp. N3.4 TaxID=2603222 RepID=UPI00164FE55E|nr:hypothetical protein [Paenibacillus sp. N3.4]